MSRPAVAALLSFLIPGLGQIYNREVLRGLFWLIIAKDAAGPDETWITDMYTSALAQANESERALAHKYLEDWLNNRRE